MALLTFVSGCAATRPVIERRALRPSVGTYYEVQRGDTLWKISKIYDVEVNDIVRANKLPDPTRINTGQKLYIPKSLPEKDYAMAYTRSASNAIFSWPVKGKVISYFGAKKGLVANKGIDIEAKEGSDVVAAGDGIVSYADENMKGMGKTIIIDHENGFSTVYAHNAALLVKGGDTVKRNQAIAKVGNTGRAETPFLHFQIRKGHEPQNPFYYLP